MTNSINNYLYFSRINFDGWRHRPPRTTGVKTDYYRPTRRELPNATSRTKQNLLLYQNSATKWSLTLTIHGSKICGIKTWSIGWSSVIFGQKLYFLKIKYIFNTFDQVLNQHSYTYNKKHISTCSLRHFGDGNGIRTHASESKYYTKLIIFPNKKKYIYIKKPFFSIL